MGRELHVFNKLNNHTLLIAFGCNLSDCRNFDEKHNSNHTLLNDM